MTGKTDQAKPPTIWRGQGPKRRLLTDLPCFACDGAGEVGGAGCPFCSGTGLGEGLTVCALCGSMDPACPACCPDRRWDAVVLDPPWAERGAGLIKRGADRHYPLVRTADMPGVLEASGEWRLADNALAWVWCTASFLEDALWLIEALELRRCAMWIWAKVDKVAGDDDAFKPAGRLGLGQWSRVEHELLLLARRGYMPVPPPEKRQRSMIYAPRGRHSAKPEAAWRVIEATTKASLGESFRGCEFFARRRRLGWWAMGNEIDAADVDDGEGDGEVAA